jgi:hypothetical protein
MQQVAYRFVPCARDDLPLEPSQFTLVATERLGVGSTIDVELLGYSRWEVVELRPESRPLLGASDRLGNEVPLAGSVVCRGIA